MDYLAEILAMKKRYQRNRVSWQPHLEKTRWAILSAAEHCQNRGSVVVLGAGLLLDAPLPELSEMFREVILIDVVVLPEIRKSAARYGNVRVVQHDVTNVAQKLCGTILHGSSELPEPEPLVPEIDAHTGLVVSLNILSQLWVIPRAYALRKLRGLEDDDQIDEWCGRITASHYAWLLSLSCDHCLIADYEYTKREREGSIVSRGSTLYGLALPLPDTSWTWNIAPLGEDRRYLSKELQVGAWFSPGLPAGERSG